MNDDAAALRGVWMSSAETEGDLRTAVSRVLERDRVERQRERRVGAIGAVLMLLLVPVLIWASAHGVVPLIRVAYALMATGCTAGVTAQWLYLAWSRRALPGPNDTRAQLQTTAMMFECQLWLARTSALWSAPVFIGILLICVWLLRERSAAGAAALAVVDLTAWIGGGTLASRAAASLGQRKRQLEATLADLCADPPPAHDHS